MSAEPVGQNPKQAPLAVASAPFPTWRQTLSAPFLLLPIWALLAQYLPPTPFTSLAGCVTLLVLAVCSYTDARWGKIRNTTTYPAILAALAIAACDTVLYRQSDNVMTGQWTILGNSTLLESVMGAFLAFFIMMVIYHLAGGGAGDVKLATALGALLGPTVVLEVILWTYVVAGVCITAWLILTLGPSMLLVWLGRRIGSVILPGLVEPPPKEGFAALQGKVKLAPFFALGTLAVLTGMAGTLELLSKL